MKKYLTYLLIILFLFPVCSRAQVIINEIMYNPGTGVSSNEWIELKNNGSETVDISGWGIFEGNSLKKFSNPSGATVIEPDGFAIIKKNSGDFSFSFSGAIFTSTFSLNNDKDVLSLRDENEVEIHSASYTSSYGASGDGNSLQWNGSDWFAAPPTPGAANNESSGEILGASTNLESSSSGGSSASSVSITSSDGGKLEVSAGGDRLTSPGSPVVFQAVIKKNTTQGKPDLSWSFGDGYVGEGNRASHTYKHPGDYVVVLSAKVGEVYSISRVKVKVTESNVSLLEAEDYIEISNNSSSEINLFQWKLTSHGKGFIFQPDTIILPKSKLRIDRSLLSMKGEKMETALQNSERQTVVALERSLGEDVSERVKALEEQAYSLVALAVRNGLVTEKSPPVVSKVVPIVASTQEVVSKEELIVEEEGISQKGDIIYESPKSESIFSKLTNFVKSVFSR